VKPERLDSKLEATGAEFLVLGRLLIEGVQAFQAYTNQPDYDIIAAHPLANTSCRIQVKSRWATDSNKSFPIRKFGCDFVVFVLLNRGVRYRRIRTDESPRREPDFYVIPIDVAKSAHVPGRMSVVRLRDISNSSQYLDNWQQVRQFLGATSD
jgi:hypothetical protein